MDGVVIRGDEIRTVWEMMAWCSSVGSWSRGMYEEVFENWQTFCLTEYNITSLVGRFNNNAGTLAERAQGCEFRGKIAVGKGSGEVKMMMLHGQLEIRLFIEDRRS